VRVQSKGEIQAATVNLFGKNGVGLVEIVRKLEIYYDSPRTKFWARNDREGCIMVKDTDVRRILGESGFRKTAKKDENVFQIDALLTAIQRSNDVDYAGSPAGYHRGVYEIGGNRVLVRDSPKIIEPAAGDWKMWETIIVRMFGTAQLSYLYGWIKIAFEALYSRNFRVGQALALAGPKDCGKSLLQELITVMLGGRCAKPHRYMSGGSDFNGELFGAEHLVLIHVLESIGDISKMFVISFPERFQEKLFTDILSILGISLRLQRKPDLPLEPGLAEIEFHEFLSEHRWVFPLLRFLIHLLATSESVGWRL
jgi:hypothetical protein